MLFKYFYLFINLSVFFFVVILLSFYISANFCDFLYKNSLILVMLGRNSASGWRVGWAAAGGGGGRGGGGGKV